MQVDLFAGLLGRVSGHLALHVGPGVGHALGQRLLTVSGTRLLKACTGVHLLSFLLDRVEQVLVLVNRIPFLILRIEGHVVASIVRTGVIILLTNDGTRVVWAQIVEEAAEYAVLIVPHTLLVRVVCALSRQHT